MILFIGFCTIFSYVFITLAAAGSLYQLLAAYAVGRFAVHITRKPHERPPVTLLKPLCGDEAGLYQNLRSFCELDYPGLQIVCGVRDTNDAAIAVVRRLQRDLPQVDLTLVCDPALHGANYKVSNLINMMPAAKHDVLVLSDSDMRVGPAYLDAVIDTLQQPGTGVATCLYIGRPVPGRWSAIGAAGINFWFLPSAVVSKFLGGKVGCYGATIALWRRTLDAVGGFAALKDQLADDYALGALVRNSGRDIVVARYFPSTTVDERDWWTFFRHELRWARTIRNTAPVGFALSAITHPAPLAMLAMILGLVAGIPFAMLISALGCACLCRLALIVRIRDVLPAPKPLWWLIFPRDVLSLAILVLAYCGRSISWRERAFRLDSVGALSQETDGL